MARLAAAYDRTPEIKQFATDGKKDLVEMPLIARLRSPPFQPVDERAGPTPEALVAQCDVACDEDQLDLAQAEAEPVI